MPSAYSSVENFFSPHSKKIHRGQTTLWCFLVSIIKIGGVCNFFFLFYQSYYSIYLMYKHHFVVDLHHNRMFVATWNVGGKSPHEGLTLGDWLRTSTPADIYVLGYACFLLFLYSNFSPGTRPFCKNIVSYKQ